MYKGHILVGDEYTFFVSNEALTDPLLRIFLFETCEPCDEYESMPSVIEKLIAHHTFFPRKLKYVIGTKSAKDESPNIEMAVVFPDYISHDRVHLLFDRLLYAGFVHFTKNGPSISGESISLRLMPGPNDLHVLKRCLGDNYWRGKF